MAWTLPEVQANIAKIKLRIGELLDDNINSYTLNQRQMNRRSLKEYEENLKIWEQREADLQATSSGESTSVVYAQFQRPT
jgi:hypothetical protein